MRPAVRASLDGDRAPGEGGQVPYPQRGSETSFMTTPACLAPPSILHTFSPSLSQEGGREGRQLPPPFWVTRETGAWAWGGARNLGVLPPSLRLRLCL